MALIQGVSPETYYATPNTPLVIPCSPLLTHLAASSHKLISQCNEREFCLPNPAPTAFHRNTTAVAALGSQPWRNPKRIAMDSVCAPRRCRRDLHPFGYPEPLDPSRQRRRKSSQTETISGIVNHALDIPPPLCPIESSFCPDDGSGCQSLLPPSFSCELDRDDQCQPPSKCLHGVCTPAIQTIQQNCSLEVTLYMAENQLKQDGTGTPYETVVMKHDCAFGEGLFCEAVGSDDWGIGMVQSVATTTIGGASTSARVPGVCKLVRPLGQVCRFDIECETGNCHKPTPGPHAMLGKCAFQPETPTHITPPRVFGLVFSLSLVLAVLFISLAVLARRKEDKKHAEFQAYVDEQIGLRRAILSLRSAATTAMRKRSQAQLHTGTHQDQDEFGIKTHEGGLPASVESPGSSMIMTRPITVSPPAIDTQNRNHENAPAPPTSMSPHMSTNLSQWPVHGYSSPDMSSPIERPLTPLPLTPASSVASASGMAIRPATTATTTASSSWIGGILNIAASTSASGSGSRLRGFNLGNLASGFALSGNGNEVQAPLVTITQTTTTTESSREVQVPAQSNVHTGPPQGSFSFSFSPPGPGSAAVDSVAIAQGGGRIASATTTAFNATTNVVANRALGVDADGVFALQGDGEDIEDGDEEGEGEESEMGVYADEEDELDGDDDGDVMDADEQDTTDEEVDSLAEFESSSEGGVEA